MGRITIATGEVNSNCEVDLTTSNDVVQKGVCSSNLCVCVCVCVCE